MGVIRVSLEEKRWVGTKKEKEKRKECLFLFRTI